MRTAERSDAEDAGSSVVERVTAILTVLGETSSGAGVSEVARRTELAKSTTARLLRTMEANGLLERSGTVYRLGIKVFELGSRVPRGRGLREAARPFMTDLRDATRNTVHLAVLDGADVVYLEVLRGPDAPALPTRVGGRWPAHATAVGKAILAHSDPLLVDEVLAAPMPRLSTRTLSGPGLLATELKRIRERGSAFDFEESKAGLVCTASPVFGAEGEVVAGLSVSGWNTRMNVELTSAAVRTAAMGVSREVGRSP
ncbi:IclR family transcriptional regulator [Pseudonocardia alni]|uniref:IclR family transcriptional regulator n=1 Tax=Pseudonocardia alni TaxID=33907 RepID=UPI0033E776F7